MSIYSRSKTVDRKKSKIKTVDREKSKTKKAIKRIIKKITKKRFKYFAVAIAFFGLGSLVTFSGIILFESTKSNINSTNSSQDQISYSSDSNVFSSLASSRSNTPSSSEIINDPNDPFPIMIKQIDNIQTSGIRLHSRAVGNYFYTQNSDTKIWTGRFLKGVNMGLTLPETDLNNPNIPYETYMRWFKQIKEMNANTIKVFTVMNPSFYNAFYDYNQKNKGDPLYLLQGIWINENDMYEIGDAYGKNNKILNDFKRTAREIVDIIHGNSRYTSYGEIESAIYDKDISAYVIGFILGLEWDYGFIGKTNENNPSKKTFTGKYLKTQNSSPFEAFLCNTGNHLIEYQTNNYKTQTPIAFLNWSTTDILTHSNEPFPEEDAVSLDTNHIKSTKDYYPGQFAALDIYPYYPEFLNYQDEYIKYKDPSGFINPYRAYLKDLKAIYKMPIIVAEFGVPTSRGIAHKSIMGYNQGGISENDQGNIIIKMLSDIAKEGCAGGMIFSWQDEWFKQTWNTVKFYADNPSKRTPNRQSAEQSYGILTYEIQPQNPLAQPFYPDGKIDEWAGIYPLIMTDGNGQLLKQTKNSDELTLDLSVSLQSDALNILIQWDESKFNPTKDSILVALGTTSRGSTSYNSGKVTFTTPAGYLILIDKTKESKVLTDFYNDVFYYQYMVTKKVFSLTNGIPKQNMGIFNPIRQFLSNEIYLPVTKKTISPVFYDSGILKQGNANPDMDGFDSLADINITDKFAEVKIPWTLLNITNFPEKIRIADFYANKKLTFEKFKSIEIGTAFVKDNSNKKIEMKNFFLPDIETITYKERLKKSYAIIKEHLADIMN